MTIYSARKKLPEWIEIKGKVGKVIQSTEGIEFELDTAEPFYQLGLNSGLF